MTAPKRPMLTTEDRARLRRLATMAEARAESSNLNRAYCRGVADLATWLDRGEVSPMLEEILR